MERFSFHYMRKYVLMVVKKYQEDISLTCSDLATKMTYRDTAKEAFTLHKKRTITNHNPKHGKTPWKTHKRLL